MTSIHTARGARVDLGKRLGGGGEAEVFAIVGSSRAAKIYRDTLSPADLRAKQQKIQAMLAMPPADPGKATGHASLAWPTEILFDARRQFAGYAMPQVDNVGTLAIVSNPKGRQIASIGFDWRYLHRTGANMASAVDAVHRIGHTIGDFNPNNVLITNRALVTLIDTDSFQIVDASGRIHGCGVGIDQYLAPERVRGGLVTPEQDHFVMAVLIFQLLMGGFHPFDGGSVVSAYSTALLPVTQYLKQGVFPFLPNGQAVAPDGAPNFNLLRSDVREAFLRTFVTGHARPALRVPVREWIDVLQQAESDLVQCRRNREHVYYGSVGTCIWCEQGQRAQPRPVPRPRAVPQNPMAPAAAPPQPPSRTGRALSASAAVAQRINPAFVGVILVIMLVGALASRRPSLAGDDPPVTQTYGTDTALTATNPTATDTVVTDTMATDTVATSTADAFAAIGAELSAIRFFSTPDGVLPNVAERHYGDRFERAESRSIGWQADFTHPLQPNRVPFLISAVYRGPDGAELATQEFESYVDAGWADSSHAHPGVDLSQWPAGTYTVAVSANGRALGSATFELVDPSSGFSTLGARATLLRLFPSGASLTPYDQRRYTNEFNWSDLGLLGFELHLDHDPTGRTVPFRIESIVWRDGTEVSRREHDSWVEGTWQSSHHSFVLDASQWQPGAYVLEIAADGRSIATRTFEIRTSSR